MSIISVHLFHKNNMLQGTLNQSSFSDTYEVAKAILAHELGHAIGLRDLYVSPINDSTPSSGIDNRNKLMYGYWNQWSTGSLSSTPNATDILGVRTIQGWLSQTAVNNTKSNLALNSPNYVSASYAYVSEEEMYKQADLIVKAKVKNISDEPVEDQRVYLSKVNLKVDEHYLDDGKKSKEIIVYQDGNSSAEFNENRLLKLGEECILFLRKTQDGSYIMIGGPQGRFDIFTENGNEKIQNHMTKHINKQLEKEDYKVGQKPKDVIEFINEVKGNVLKYKK